jgi:predicted RNase H-like nuclease
VGSSRVLGVDGYRDGWVGVVLAGDVVSGYVHADIGGLVALAAAGGPIDVIGIDIPIGLAEASIRQADLLARQALGARWSSVFLTPVRPALLLGSHRAASDLNKELTGLGISTQAFNLRDKILQVDAWRAEASGPVLEVHPELSFAAMNGGQPLAASKATWPGAVQRRQLLSAQGIRLPDDLIPASARAGVDDVLDAAAVAWTARRRARGEAQRRPAEPEIFSDGVDCAIWT